MDARSNSIRNNMMFPTRAVKIRLKKREIHMKIKNKLINFKNENNAINMYWKYLSLQFIIQFFLLICLPLIV